MRRLALLILILSLVVIRSYAQNPRPRFELSVAALYSLNDNLVSEEFSLAYKWDKAIIKANFECYDLINAENVFGESFSLAIPQIHSSTEFMLCPEFGIGIIHGSFQEAERITIKPQVFTGTVLNYDLNKNLDSGLILRYGILGKSSRFYLGFKVAAQF